MAASVPTESAMEIEKAEAAAANQLPPTPYQFSDRALEFIRGYTDKRSLIEDLKYLATAEACAEVYTPQEGGNACDLPALESKYVRYFKLQTEKMVMASID